MGKRTPLYGIHKQMGADIVDFGGWDMPIQYSGIIDEHINTRERVGLFDVSHMAELEISGNDAATFVQFIITNDVSCLCVGKALYTPLCYENGFIVDDVIVYMTRDDCFLLVVNASNADKDLAWIRKMSIGYDVNILDVSSDTAQLSLQGPEAEAVLASVAGDELRTLEYFNFTYSYLDDVRALISRTGYTGEDGFELYVAPEDVAVLWERLLAAGDGRGIKPVGLGARDTLRLEAGFRLYGNDIDGTTTPLEAGLGWTVRFNKGDFVGRDALSNQRGNIGKRLAAFEMIDKPVARRGYPVIRDDMEIGRVTSGTYSPSLSRPIGMAYVDAGFSGVGEIVDVLVRERRCRARIVALPFAGTKG